MRWTHQSSFAGASSGEGFAGEGSSSSASLASMVKRRRSRSWASGAGLTLIATTRSSSEAPSRLFCFVLRVASFKVVARVASAWARPSGRDWLDGRPPVLHISVDDRRTERYPLRGAYTGVMVGRSRRRRGCRSPVELNANSFISLRVAPNHGLARVPKECEHRESGSEPAIGPHKVVTAFKPIRKRPPR